MEKIANLLADGGAAGLARDEDRNAGLLEPHGHPLDLGGFPAAFGSFECDKNAARHLSECETKEHSCRIAPGALLHRDVKNYWLVKQEPSAYSWENFVADGKTAWTGVRNYTARNNLRAMRKDDQVFFYHSVTDKAVMGVAKVVREAYPDPTATEGEWSAVDLAPEKALPRPVTLDEIKRNSKLKGIALLRLSRLSVQPLAEAEFQEILKMAKR